MPPEQPVRDQAGDSGAAGVIGTQDLSEKDPQRDQGGEDAVEPAGHRGQCLGDGLLGEDVGERQVTVLKELTFEKLHLLLEPLLVRMAHRWGLLAVDGYVGNHHLRR